MTVVGGGGEMDDEKPRTILVGNLPRDTHKREIEEVFGDIGPLKRCYIQYPRDDKKKHPGGKGDSALLCYITYALPEDATTAVERLSGHKFGSNKVHVKLSKNNRSVQVREKVERPVRGGDNKKQDLQSGEEGGEDYYQNPNMIPVGGEKPKKPKAPRPKPINKKSRLIVRNLSFKVTEEKIKEHFGNCGEIKEVNVLKKPNGRLVGCAFIQFATVPQAAKAVRELNLKEFLGRPIAIDWALSKKNFQEDKGKEKGDSKDEIMVKSEDEENDVEIKEEPASDDEDKKFENPYQEMEVEVKEEDGEDFKISKKRKIKDQKDSDEEDEEDYDSGEDEDELEEDVDEPASKRPRKSNDVEDGKTLFIRNLDFGVTQDSLKEFFEGFGKLVYALLCKDPLTEHPKGTGFVKFQDVDAVNKCLTEYNSEPTKFKLENRQFNIMMALPKEKVELSNKNDKSEKVKKDSRNLYLVREGFVRPGSSAAVGVSAADLNKRAALNSTKKQLLKNFNIFISPTRLCVHNLPPKFTDKSLRRLFKRHSPAETRITEARIMRDMKDIQLDGKGQSKGYGFITFTEHEHALAVLREVNNNPNVFTPNQRPIVEFSLENRRALQAKEQRKQKSIDNSKLLQSGRDKTQRNKKKQNSGDDMKKLNRKPKTETNSTNNEKDKTSYSGLTGKPGVSKIPMMKPKGKQGKISRKSLKPKKSLKKKFQDRKMREPKVKSTKRLDKGDKTEKIISKYKQKLEKSASAGAKKGKWYK